MDEQRTYRVVGIRADGSRSVVARNASRQAAKEAMARLVDEQIFTSVLIEPDPEGEHFADPVPDAG